MTNLAACPDGTPTAEFVIDADHRLFQIEKSFTRDGVAQLERRDPTSFTRHGAFADATGPGQLVKPRVAASSPVEGPVIRTSGRPPCQRSSACVGRVRIALKPVSRWRSVLEGRTN